MARNPVPLLLVLALPGPACVLSTDTRPVISEIILSPTAPLTDDLVEATLMMDTRDGALPRRVIEGQTGLHLTWYVNDEAVGASGFGLDGASLFDRGDQIRLEATLSVDVPPTVSPELTVHDSAPTAPWALISPEAPVADVDPLICQIALPSLDPDGDPVAYSFTWWVNGDPWTGGQEITTIVGDTIPADVLRADDTWTCAARPDDGTLPGPVGTAEVKVQGVFVGWSPSPTPLALAPIAFDGMEAESLAGEVVAAPGDLDNDGVPDLLIAAPGSGQGLDLPGRVCFVTGAGLPAKGTFALDDSQACLMGEKAGEGLGESVALLGDLDADGVDDLLLGAPHNWRNGPDAGVAWVVSGADLGAGTELVSDKALWVLEGTEDHDLAGQAVAASDVDGDGSRDVFVGAPQWSAAAPQAGRVFLLPAGRLAGTGTVLLDNEGSEIQGASSMQAFGQTLAGGADADGDGIEDLVIGAPGDSSLGIGAGMAWFVRGGDVPLGALTLAGDIGVALRPEAAGDAAASALSWAGDVDGDGLPDLLVGGPGHDDDAGMAWLLMGSTLSGATGLDLRDADYRLDGEAPGDRAGAALGTAGDVDRDDLDDILVGAPGHDDDAGAAYLVLGGSLGVATTLNLLLTDWPFRGEASDRAGTSVAGLGDLDGDGLSDFLIGAPGHDLIGRAALFLP